MNACLVGVVVLRGEPVRGTVIAVRCPVELRAQMHRIVKMVVTTNMSSGLPSLRRRWDAVTLAVAQPSELVR